MANSLLFIPDISGYTNFVNNTEIEHSQHVIAELLEVLINANKENLELAEIEGDALFFYKHNQVPSQEKLLAQIEAMFTAFHEHLHHLENYRICPCNACKTAPQLELKIVAHAKELQFIEVLGKKKPFGPAVIEAHRLLKNNIPSSNYSLITKDLANSIKLSIKDATELFPFTESSETYDSKNIEFLYAPIDNNLLKIDKGNKDYSYSFDRKPDILLEAIVDIPAEKLHEFISNFKYRVHWNDQAELIYNAQEVNKLGSKHVCVVNKQHLDFTTITKEQKGNEFIYGETTNSPVPIDNVFQFFTSTVINENKALLNFEVYLEAKSILKKLLLKLFIKKIFYKNAKVAFDKIVLNAPKVMVD